MDPRAAGLHRPRHVPRYQGHVGRHGGYRARHGHPRRAQAERGCRRRVRDPDRRGRRHPLRPRRRRGALGRGVRARCATSVDLVLLAGDLTTHGEPEQARCSPTPAGRSTCRSSPCSATTTGTWTARDEVVAVLEEGGVDVLEREHRGARASTAPRSAIVGAEGLRRRLRRLALPDFGEPLLREVYAETTARGEAIDAALREIALCPFRIVLLHYAPIDRDARGRAAGTSGRSSAATGSPRRSRAPPDLVLHGHAHAGSFEGRSATCRSTTSRCR